MIASPDEQAWRDPSRPPSERAELLLSAMTPADKIDLVTRNMGALTHLGLPPIELVDASCGLRGDTGVTAFPSATALSATFDADLAYEYGAAIGREAREHGWSVILGPTVDVERRGTSGRLPEGYGEDPLLNALIGERVARGMLDQHVIPCVKHYTAYNQETGRHTLAIEVSERALQEIYNAPFHKLIADGVAPSIMGAYPKINGTYACQNGSLLAALRSETGWQGFMMPDFKAGDDPLAGFNAGMDFTALYTDFPLEAFTDGRVAEGRLDEAATRILYACFDSGLFDDPVKALDQHRPVSTPRHKAVAQRTAEQGTVLLLNKNQLLPLSRDEAQTLAVIGCANRDVITGVEGSSYVDPGDFVTPLDAIRSAVGDGVRVLFAQGSYGDQALPSVPAAALETPDGTSRGLLGTFYADAAFGGEPIAEQVTPTLDFSAAPVDLPPAWSARWTGRITCPTSGLVNFSVLCTGTIKVWVAGRCVISGHRDVSYFIQKAYGYPLHGAVEMTADEPVDIVVELSTPLFPLDFVMGKHLHLGWQTDQLMPEATGIAEQVDTAIVFVNQAAGEGMDRDFFSLSTDQNRLIEAVAQVNPNTIVVLNTPGAVSMPWLHKVAAVLQVWYPGEAVGTAISSVLFGAVDPGGRLPITFPATEEQALPPYDGSGKVAFDEDIFVGYRSYQNHRPLFPFGYGLSYSSFQYGDLEIMPPDNVDHVARVQLTVKNSGALPGTDVVQVYVGELPVAVPTPTKQLAGFAKVQLAPNEQTRVEIQIPRRVISYWDEASAGWVAPAGTVSLFVGSSSVDEQLTGSFTLQRGHRTVKDT